MTAGSPAPVALWMDLEADKLGWAYRAYHRFISQLSPDVGAHLTNGAVNAEPYVVVFGRTQVGKTTLLLELMGLGVPALTRVGKVLRGGREQGKSATATTMEYRRSPDHDWYLHDGTGKRRIDTDEEMCAALGELRLTMSKQHLPAGKPVVVSIPADCFAGGTHSGIGNRMLDLPGDSPADPVEQEHVVQMAKRYVPHADLILLVGRGDDLTFLNPEALALPGIEDWQFVPNRFRIVTTFSFTPDTVRDFARDHPGELCPDHVRRRLITQIGTFERPLAPEAAQPERFFPLELGQSWQTMLSTDSELSARVQPVVEELKAQLHQDIRASANETARFRNAVDVNFVAKRKRAACIAHGKAELAALAERIAKADAVAVQAGESERKAAQQCEAIQSVLEVRHAAQEELQSALSFDPDAHVERVDDVVTNTRAMFGLINDFTSWLRQQFLEKVPSGGKSRKFWGHSHPDMGAHITKVNSIAGDEFAALCVRMSEYWSDEYYPSVSDSFATDKARLKRDMRDAAEKTAKLAENLWRKQIASRAAELEEQAAEMDSERVGLQQIATLQRTILKTLEMQRVKVQDEMCEAVTRFDRDVGIAAQFAMMLDEEYLVELQHRHARIAAAYPVDALLTLLSAHGLAEEHRKIMLS